MSKKQDLFLSEALVEKGIASTHDLDGFLREATAASLSLQEYLIKRKLAQEQDILQALAQKMGVGCIELRTASIERAVLDKVPVKIASYYKFIPFAMQGRVLSIAVASPLEIKIQDEIRTQLGLEIQMHLACTADIAESFKKYYGLAAGTLEEMHLRDAGGASAGEEQQSEKIEDIEKLAEDASVISLVNQIILEAFRKRATDIHIEPYRGVVSVRYRVDGILYDANVPAEIKNFLNAIISRIKIMSNLNIVERRMPQDGRAVVRVQDQTLDLRISTIPTPHGESVVIRILPSQMLFNLEKLGLLKNELKLFEQLILKPHGIVFVTGPTGSGKTTTLYACLSRINTKDRKIVTIEDPIEYEMSGITQIQVQPEIGLDFARGLRSILRHDPDVIMVGEVRDLETAEIAIRVALTGHLVFSTLHTNDAPSGITRLIDIGVEPYLLASSVVAFVAQRLIRLLCPYCKYEDTQASEEVKKLIASELHMDQADEVKIFRGKGCASCNFTGFFGRTGIYEIVLIDELMRDLIIKKTPSEDIKKLAISRGMQTLRQDGWRKVISGITSPEEVIKVAAQEETPRKEEAAVSSSVLEADSPTSLFIERRAYAHLGCAAKLRYRIFNPAEKSKKEDELAQKQSVTKNVSAGGLLFVAHEVLPLSAILAMTIELPDGEPAVECLARVVRVEITAQDLVFNVAACFLDLTGAQRTRIDKFVEAGLG